MQHTTHGEPVTDGTGARYLRTTDAARYLGVSARTLTNWRWRGGGHGPAFVRAGRSVRYDVRTLDAWMARRTFASTSAADANARAVNAD